MQLAARAATVLVLVLALGARVLAQESRPAPPGAVEVARMLESGDPRAVAWGAFHARAAGLQKALPHLLAALAFLRTAPADGLRRHAALQVLDALLAAKAPLHERELGGLLDDDETRTPGLALLAIDPARNLPFFARLWADPGARRSAWEQALAGDMLARTRAGGFAAAQLRELELRLVVRRGPSRDRSGCCGAICTSFVGERVAVPEGLPPSPFFRWSSAPDCDEPGVSVVRIEGARWPLEKRVCADARAWVYSEPAPEIGTFLRLDWLAAALGGTRDTLGFDATTVVESRWDDAAGRARAVAAARRELEAKHAAIVARLVAAGALTAREARGVPCDPELVVDDPRPTHDEPALPEDGPRRAAAIGRLLESADPESIAWGAFHAKRMPGGVGAALPSLCAALGTLRSPKTHGAEQESERECAALQVLDALLTADAVVGEPELGPFLERSETRRPALALLARAPRDSHEQFVRLEGSEEGWEQLLAGNVLAAGRAPGFAARLLEQIRFRLQVRVLGPHRRGLSCGGAFGRILDEVAVPEGLPPTPFFRWDHEPSEGGVPVAGRTRPVWLRRAVVDPGRRDSLGDSLCRRIDDTTRLGWLRDELPPGAAAQIELSAETRVEIEFRDAAQYAQEGQDALRRIRAAHERLVAGLLGVQALGAQEARAAQPRIFVLVSDGRMPGAPKLPRIDPAR